MLCLCRYKFLKHRVVIDQIDIYIFIFIYIYISIPVLTYIAFSENNRFKTDMFGSLP